MRKIKIEKLTLNIGAGKNPDVLKKGTRLLKNITGLEPVKTVTQKRIPNWGLRPGLPIGCKITLRKQQAYELVTRLLDAKSKKLKSSNVDNNGNVSFGIHEYIDIPGVKYDPEIGIMGLQACITLERNGFRVKRRRIGPAKLPQNHRIARDEAIQYLTTTFNVQVSDEE
ncbi:50S ribosomal protein L5 [Candidatus Woesearchaeota archaeon]|nr:50S ribosomal protein L5 [Candidatus Woesearchaeota archaeon]